MQAVFFYFPDKLGGAGRFVFQLDASRRIAAAAYK